MRILLVEDDNRVADALSTALRRHGYEVTRAGTGQEALAASTVDLVLLDLGLPDTDGIEVCRVLRRRGHVAIIAVTARGEERHRVAGLRAGADDYVVKPFGMAELRARIDAVMRRVRPHERVGWPDPIALGPLRIDFARHQITRDGQPISLTRKEFDLLTLLAREPGTVVPREHILAEVWQTTWRGAGRTLDVHVATLRAKLGDPAIVETVRGVGYRLAVDAPAPPHRPTAFRIETSDTAAGRPPP